MIDPWLWLLHLGGWRRRPIIPTNICSAIIDGRGWHGHGTYVIIGVWPWAPVLSLAAGVIGPLVYALDSIPSTTCMLLDSVYRLETELVALMYSVFTASSLVGVVVVVLVVVVACPGYCIAGGL